MVVISIDGVDGAGKTTVAALLASAIPAEVVKTPLKEFLPDIKSFLDNSPENTLARFVYFMCGNKHACDVLTLRYNGSLSEQNIVFDRYKYSTLATHLALDEMFSGGVNIARLHQIADKTSEALMKPDLIVFLYVDYDVKTQRITLRKNPADTKLDNNKQFSERTETQLRSLARSLRAEGVNVLELDTTKESPEAIRDAIIAAVPNRVRLIART
jgi:thymidylate kinase